VWRVLKDAGLVPSSAEAWRMIQQGAVEIDGIRVADGHRRLESGRSYLVRVGKRRFGRVVIQAEP
jgi:tyrosyl-tRNA synthetase